MKSKILSTFCISVLFPISCLHSQVSPRDSVNLSEVVVTGSKTAVSGKIVPVSVSQVSRMDIENSGQTNILTALGNYVPGYFVTERGNFGFGVGTGGSGAISMRGISSQPNTSILVLIDGQPQYQGLFGHPLADAYAASQVEKVEVIRGPASTLYGSNAMAGVINLITRKPNAAGMRLTGGVSYGAYNTQKYDATAGYKKDKWNIFASANHDRTDGARENTDFRISNGYLKTGYEIDKRFTLSADIDMALYDANDNGSVYAAPAPFHIDITRGKASVSFDNRFQHADGSVRAYHNFGKHILSDGFRSTDRNSGLMIYETVRVSSKTSVTAGIDLKEYGGKANRGLNADSSITIQEAAVYVYVQQHIGDRLILSGGLRGEHHSQHGSEIVPMGGLTFRVAAYTSLKASVSKGFRNPTIMELYLYAPNPDLKPERMMNYEIGWQQIFLEGKLALELTGFYADGNNLILATGSGAATKRQNIGTFRNKGVEFSVKYLIISNLMLHANYSFTDIEKAVLAAPRQLVSLGVDYKHKVWSGNFNLQQVGKLYARILPEPVTESYALMNVRISAQANKHLSVYAAGNNLLDSRYQINYGYPMPGFNWSVGMKFNY